MMKVLPNLLIFYQTIYVVTSNIQYDFRDIHAKNMTRGKNLNIYQTCWPLLSVECCVSTSSLLLGSPYWMTVKENCSIYY